MEKRIISLKGYEVLDSRGNPTVKAEVTLSGGIQASATVPSGASTGIYEAVELRDKNENRFWGKGVLKSVENINEVIRPALSKLNTINQWEVDQKLIELDGTKSKQNLGANTTLAVSLAFAKAVSQLYNVPLYRYIGGVNAVKLPVPMMNILNGGAHSSNNVDIQEFMIMPIGAKSFHEGLRWCAEIYHTLGTILKTNGLQSNVGDEGGFAPNLSSDEEAIELIMSAIKKSGYNISDVKIALDAASSEWFSNGVYNLPKRKTVFKTDEMIEYWYSLCQKYPIISIEDGLGQDDWSGWEKLTNEIGDTVQLVGDDLFVTNKERLGKGIIQGVANSIIIKPNQIGTLTETLKTIEKAKSAGYRTIVSHRSGETEDTSIADIAVATNAGQIKAGAPCRSERVAKYNRLLQIENDIKGYKFKNVFQSKLSSRAIPVSKSRFASSQPSRHSFVVEI